MDLGGIRREGQRKLFLISTTHGAESTGLAAMLATIAEFKEKDMIASNWARGESLRNTLQASIQRHGLDKYLSVVGYPCLLALVCRNSQGTPDDAYRTLFMQEMIARGVLFQGLLYTTWSHQQPQLDEISHAFDQSCEVYKASIAAGNCDQLLVGPSAKPVFRRTI